MPKLEEREREATSRIRREDLGDISKKKKFFKLEREILQKCPLL